MAVSEIRRLTLARRQQQASRAAAIAAYVAMWYRRRVKVDDPASIQRWLELMIPKIMDEHDKQAIAAAKYGDTLRRLELKQSVATRPSFTFEPSPSLVIEQVERSLRYLGPERELAKLKILEDRAPYTLPEREDESREIKISRANTRQALEEEAHDLSAQAVAGSVARHAQNGARQTLYDNIQADPVCLGYLRVTKTDPCYFCAALASRGIIYGEDSFDLSDPRFTGSGTAKVHDSCACHLKPVYTDSDEFTVDAANFEALWERLSDGGSMLEFRRNYENRSDGPRRPPPVVRR